MQLGERNFLRLHSEHDGKPEKNLKALIPALDRLK